MENWRAYVNEQEGEVEAPAEGGLGRKVATGIKKVGSFISKKWQSMDDDLKNDYCTKKFPEFLTGQGDIETFGDLVALLKCTVEYTNKKKALSILANLIPAVASAREVFEQSQGVAGFILKMYQVEDDQRPQGNLGKLDMDDEIATILDDKVENMFVKDLINVIQQTENLDAPIADNWSVTDALKKYLEDEYEKRTITGYDGEG
jgi:hypothetical protein